MSRQNRSGGGGASAPLDSKSRQNEFFVHREGIDRDVITADICTYLGNDALVKPGVWLDEKTGIEHHGYYVTAYRNLTTAMIEDLKADSARWEQERRKHQNSAVRYEGSNLQYHNRSQPGYSGGKQPHPNYDSGSYQQGYSQGGSSSKQAYSSGYGGSTGYSSGTAGAYPPQSYSTGPGGYSSAGMDPRTSYSSGGMTSSQMPQMATGGYSTGGMGGASMPRSAEVAYAVRQDFDSPMTDAPSYGGARAYPPQQQPGGYPYQPAAGQPQAYPPGGQMTQPVDLYYGRGPGSAFPTGSTAPSAYPETAAAPVPGMPYSPGPDQYEANPVSRASAASPGAQAQVSSSGPSERRERTSEYREHREYRESRDRDRRDRDRDDRHTEKRRHPR